MKLLIDVLLLVLFSAVLSDAAEWTTVNTAGCSVRKQDSSTCLDYTCPGGEITWSEFTYGCTPPAEGGFVSLDMKSSDAGTLILILTDTAGSRAFYHFSAPVFRSVIRVNSYQPDMVDGKPLENIAQVSIAFRSDLYRSGQSVTAAIYGTSFTPAGPEKKLYSHLWLPSVNAGTVRDYDAETCVWNVWPYSSGPGWESGQAEFGGYDSEKGMNIVRGVIDFLSDTYGHGALDLPYVEKPELIEYAKNRNVKIYAEMHNSPDYEWLKENKGFAINKWGTTCHDLGVSDTSQTYDFTDDRVLEKVSEKMLKSARAGVKYIRTVDYVWTPFGPNGSWNGTIWGYSAAAIKRWREDLTGSDTGLEIRENGRVRTMYFAEYFRDYHGYDIKPEYVGYDSWQDYVPPRDGETELLIEKEKLHIMLYHYEWLKFINRAVEPCVKQYGVYAQPILNCESTGNGGDYVYLSKLTNLAGYCAEWWGSHNVILATYYNSRYYEAAAKGKEICLFGESAAAGGNPFYGRYQKPNYWDNPANCLITYSQAGSFDFKAKQDQYWGSRPERMSDPDEREYLTYTAFLSAWNGFLRAREDRLRKPQTRVMALIQRAPAGYTNNLDTAVSAPYAFNGILEKNNFLYDGASFPNTLDMNDYDILFYSPITGPAGALNDIKAWLDKGNKTLITHSFIPVNTDRPGKDINKPGIDESVPAVQKRAAAYMGFDTIKKTDIKTGKLASQLEGTEYLNGSFTLEDSLYTIEGYTPLITLDGLPLVSERLLKNGSRIIYLGFTPSSAGKAGDNTEALVTAAGAQSEAFDSAVIKAIMANLGIMPQGITGDDIAVMRYETADKGDAYILNNRSANTKWQGPEEVFNVFQAFTEVRYSSPVKVLTSHSSTKVIIRDILSGEEKTALTDKDGYAETDMNGYNLRGVYIYPY